MTALSPADPPAVRRVAPPPAFALRATARSSISKVEDHAVALAEADSSCSPSSEVEDHAVALAEADSSDASPFRPRNYTWAELMRRTFAYDVMACLECGGRMRLIAMIEQPEVIKKILDHLNLPAEPPVARPARAPPETSYGRPAGRPCIFVDLDEPIDEPAFDC